MGWGHVPGLMARGAGAQGLMTDRSRPRTPAVRVPCEATLRRKRGGDGSTGGDALGSAPARNARPST